MEIGNIPEIGWNKSSEGVVKSMPSLNTAGYSMELVQLSPHAKYELNGPKTIVCLLRGTLKGKHAPALRKSSLIDGRVSFKAGSDGCLLFVCIDHDGDYAYFENISGLKVTWEQFDSNMYKTTPQIHVDGYRINLWYLDSDKHGGIHNHATEPLPFVEFHTQLRGHGWMVKYEDKDGKKETERVEMRQGYTHDLFCSTDRKQPIYPWHEYIAGNNGTLFIAFEDTAI